MAKNRGKVIKSRPEGLLCNSLKETYLHDDTLSSDSLFKSFFFEVIMWNFSVKQRLH